MGGLVIGENFQLVQYLFVNIFSSLPPIFRLLGLEVIV